MRDYKVAVVIPTYNSWGLCGKLLENLKKHEDENIDEIIVVDDASESLVMFPNNEVKVVRNTENLGFTLSSNVGLKAAQGELAERKITFLISTDVQINGKFIEQTADILFDTRRHLVGNRHIAFDSGWNTFDGKTFDYLEGWFLAATSDGWKDLGYFDPGYAPYDMEDIDLATTAKSKSYKLVSLNNPHITHLGGGTIGFNPAREAITLRNKEYFRKKWMP